MEDFEEMSEEERKLREEVEAEIRGGVVPEATAGFEPPEKREEVKDVVEDTVDDPWTGVNPALKAAIDSLSSKVSSLDKIDYRLKQFESRVGSLDNRMRDLKTTPDQPTKEQIEKALKSETEFNEFLEDFPSHGNFLKSERERQNEMIANVRSELGTEFEKKLSQQQVGFELKLLKTKYKNHSELVSEPEFMPWLNEQAQEDKEKYGSWDAMEVIDLLDKYTARKAKKETTSSIIEERENRLDSAAADVRQPSRATKQKSEADMTDDEYRAYMAKKIWGK